MQVQMTRTHRFLQYALPVYVALLSYLMYSMRASLFALFVNPISLTDFIVRILGLLFRASAIFVGMSYLKNPRLFKLVYVGVAMLLVVFDVVVVAYALRHQGRTV